MSGRIIRVQKICDDAKESQAPREDNELILRAKLRKQILLILLNILISEVQKLHWKDGWELAKGSDSFNGSFSALASGIGDPS
jgi:hypothetical protein